jgi:kynurenine formamidase
VLIAEHLGNLGRVAGTRTDIIGLPIKIREGDDAYARFIARSDSHEGPSPSYTL